MTQDEISTYEPFARHAFYEVLNEHLVVRAIQQAPSRILDLACGTGLLSRLVDKVCQEYNSRVGQVGQRVILGIDLSKRALHSFRREVQSLGASVTQGCAEILPLRTGSFEAIFLGNAIHNIRDKVAVVREAARILRSGGIFAFNTTFFEGCYPEGTDSYYRAWVFKAIRLLRNYPGVQVSRGGKAEAMHWLTPEEYKEMLESQGFRVVDMNIEQVFLPQEAMEDISEFDDFARGALPGVPLHIAKEVLHKAVGLVFREQNRTFVPRNWLQVVTQKA